MDWANGDFPITRTLQLWNWLPCKLVKWGTEGYELSSEPAEGTSAEVERWESMISTSFITLRMDERFGHYNLCDVSIKVAYLGWRAETIYTKTQPLSPSSSVSTQLWPQSLNISENQPEWALGERLHGRIVLGAPFTHIGQALCKSQQLAVSHALPDLASSFLPPLSSLLLFKSYTCPHSDTSLHTSEVY